MGVAWVRTGAEAIADPYVGSIVHLRHVGCELMEINRINQALAMFVDTHAKRSDVPVRLIDKGQYCLPQVEPVRQHMTPEHCRIGRIAGEGIAEARGESFKHVGTGVKWNWVTDGLRDLA